jgi:hypothetical protein
MTYPIEESSIRAKVNSAINIQLDAEISRLEKIIKETWYVDEKAFSFVLDHPGLPTSRIRSHLFPRVREAFPFLRWAVLDYADSGVVNHTRAVYFYLDIDKPKEKHIEDLSTLKPLPGFEL